jgi:tetratricopeptide (TPR) repeat protein
LKSRFILAVLTAALLCACSSAEQSSVKDEQLLRSLSAARSAYLQGESELAVSLYREALERARERDDQAAIATISHDLGAAELQKGDAASALATARAALDEMGQRQMHGTAPLRLVEAVALYRLGRTVEAAAAARVVVSDDRADPVVRSRAIFVAGLIAAQAGDVATVERSLLQLRIPDQQPELAADRIELTGWRAFLVGDLPQARRAFLEAADGRRLALDYRGMGRALVAAGEAAARAGDIADAADLFLRAGRSAMIRGESAQARLWLGRAEALASRARKLEVRNQARALIHEIGDSERRLPAKP